jgi:hypothetical protein
MLMETIPATERDLSLHCAKRIEELFRKNGFLPSSHQFLFSRDPALNWKRRRRVYATTPHLRWELIASFFIHCLRGKRRLHGGRSRILSRHAPWSGDAASFYFNGLILDLLESCRAGGTAISDSGDAAGWEAGWEKEALAEFESDVIEYPQDGGNIPAWGYFPVRHHRFRPGNLVHTLMHQWGAIAADLDSSSMVLIRLLKSGSDRITALQVLTLLEGHVRGTGKYGMSALAYDNGAVAEDRGMLLWVQEKHNELDAGVNLNVLCLLAELSQRVGEPALGRVLEIASGCLEFLDRHIALGSYSQNGFLMFYSIEAFAFLWHRFDACLQTLPAPIRARFDAHGVCDKLGRHLALLLEREIDARAIPFNSFDKLLSLPVLIRYAAPAAAPWLTEISLRAMVADVSAHAYEFGKFVYPFTFLYGNQALGLCAAINVFRELERNRTLRAP